MAQRFSGLLTNNALKMCMSGVPKYKSNTAGSNVGTGKEKSAASDRKAKEEKDRKEFIPLNPSKTLRTPDSKDLKKEQEEYAKHEEQHKREGKKAQERDE